MKVDFDALSRDQQLVAIRAFMAAGSPEVGGPDFELKVNGADVDFLKFVDSFIDLDNKDVRAEAVKLVASKVRLNKLVEVVQRCEYEITKELAEAFNLD